MPIKSIEIICPPCKKCAGLESKIAEIVKSIGVIYKIDINYEFKHTINLREIQKYSLNASQTPVILVNNAVEFAGKIDIVLLRRKLENIHKTG